jgi:hypothetical protein
MYPLDLPWWLGPLAIVLLLGLVAFVIVLISARLEALPPSLKPSRLQRIAVPG